MQMRDHLQTFIISVDHFVNFIQLLDKLEYDQYHTVNLVQMVLFSNNFSFIKRQSHKFKSSQVFLGGDIGLVRKRHEVLRKTEKAL